MEEKNKNKTEFVKPISGDCKENAIQRAHELKVIALVHAENARYRNHALKLAKLYGVKTKPRR
ncbi:unnamed protein product [marine sediment metagenome]|uniref:Uncharacterized protein n=1 Tax=marine sediment metagenome TaxID=412755 RepID=X1B5B7_9ZZZZ